MLDKNTARAIAELHKNEITTGFLSRLNIQFLSTLYQAISAAPGCCVFIKKDETGSVVGFVSGTISTKKMYRFVIRNKGLLLFYYLLDVLLKPIFTKRIIETLLYSIKNSKNKDTIKTDGIESELLSVAVLNSVQGKGVGKDLIEEFERFLLDNEIKNYRVVTFSGSTISNAFYKKCGFINKGAFSHHGNILNIYIKEIVGGR